VYVNSTQPLIFVTTITLKEGKLEDFKHYSEQMGKFVEENEPRIIHFEQYINEDGTELTSVQIHPDEDSMALHMQVAGERMAQASEFHDTIKSLHIYGEPSDAFVEQMKQAASTLIVKYKYSLGSTASRQQQRLNRQVESRRDFPGPEF
jgi:hypothetical protein